MVGILLDGGDLAVGLGHEGLQLLLKQLIRGLGRGGLHRLPVGGPGGSLPLGILAAEIAARSGCGSRLYSRLVPDRSG